MRQIARRIAANRIKRSGSANRTAPYKKGSSSITQLLSQTEGLEKSWTPFWCSVRTLSASTAFVKQLKTHADCRIEKEVAANREVWQIGNVDVGVNVDIESHPVGSFTLQIERKLKQQGQNFIQNERKTQASGEDCTPLGEILRPRSRPRLRFQFGKPP